MGKRREERLGVCVQTVQVDRAIFFLPFSLLTLLPDPTMCGRPEWRRSIGMPVGAPAYNVPGMFERGWSTGKGALVREHRLELM